ncbi:Bifunctional epoxide hydrolase 2 [Hyphodiscus hymeniophilus]|uniref:Bifunctional epoxide hydrolase 2 n=1 Tax=Hyphodiscus hymeniophilus TaxID=353542 RepID=A0A9P7AXX5_9HELO|nr:Bifunctional epoxide hydrolase 2 [Hyphodiscus hymeniophilus]
MSSMHIEEHEFSNDDVKLFYLSAGPKNGPLMIFVHGWPGIAETWKPQISAFAALGFRIVAPDMRGYGRSTVTRESHDYRLERLVADMLALLASLQKKEAVWVGHDWGALVVWSLAAHFPEVCTGIVNMCVPYHTLEYGLDALLATVDREIYPADKFPNGQWDYQAYYETDSAEANKVFEADIANTIKVLYRRGDPASYGKPALTSAIIHSGGWFGGKSSAPEMGDLSRSVLDESTFNTLSDHLKRMGFFGPTSYYLNHAANKEYSERSLNGGVLDIPTLFIEAKFDGVCETSMSTLSDSMRRYCRDLTQVSIEAGHWVALERPQETNAAIARWLMTTLPTSWPGYYDEINAGMY